MDDSLVAPWINNTKFRVPYHPHNLEDLFQVILPIDAHEKITAEQAWHHSQMLGMKYKKVTIQTTLCLFANFGTRNNDYDVLSSRSNDIKHGRHCNKYWVCVCNF